MDYFSTLFDKKNMPQLVLSVLFVIYLVMGYKMPDGVAGAVDSTAGKIVVGLVALMLFAYSNPILGVLALLVAYQMIRSASVKTGMAGLEEYYPTEQKKWSPFTPAHQFPLVQNCFGWVCARYVHRSNQLLILPDRSIHLICHP